MCFYKHDNTCPCVVGWCLVDAWRAEEELVKISSLMSKILQQTMLVSTAFLMIQVIKQSTLEISFVVKSAGENKLKMATTSGKDCMTSIL